MLCSFVADILLLLLLADSRDLVSRGGVTNNLGQRESFHVLVLSHFYALLSYDAVRYLLIYQNCLIEDLSWGFRDCEETETESVSLLSPKSHPDHSFLVLFNPHRTCAMLQKYLTIAADG
jgi:hypothetical protein